MRLTLSRSRGPEMPMAAAGALNASKIGAATPPTASRHSPRLITYPLAAARESFALSVGKSVMVALVCAVSSVRCRVMNSWLLCASRILPVATQYAGA